MTEKQFDQLMELQFNMDAQMRTMWAMLAAVYEKAEGVSQDDVIALMTTRFLENQKKLIATVPLYQEWWENRQKLKK